MSNKNDATKGSKTSANTISTFIPFGTAIGLLYHNNEYKIVTTIMMLFDDVTEGIYLERWWLGGTRTPPVILLIPT